MNSVADPLQPRIKNQFGNNQPFGYTPAYQTPYAHPAPAKKNNSGWIIIVAVSLLSVAVIAAVTFFIFRDRPNNAASSGTAETIADQGGIRPAADPADIANAADPADTPDGAADGLPVGSTSGNGAVEPTRANSGQDPAVPVTQAPMTDAPTTQTAVIDPSTWSGQEIISYTVTAVNKTKAYTGSVSCQHTADFDGGTTSITGGSVVQSIANKVISSIAAPLNETVSFSGGTATNGSGEQMSMLLPNNKQFYLDANGFASASAVKNGDNIDVTITLVSESVDKNNVPYHNSNTIGFLDIGSLDIDSVTIETANVTYSGSSMKFSIMPNGYVKSAVYRIPVHIEGTGKVSFISASLVVDGVKNESFDFQW